uniref:Dormancy-associated protein homolog 3 n=1 Tax=Zea mays TaxID=4577 RepID=A0A804R7A8_MAIZE
MGLLDKLWDDTVAGPRPDTGLGRLRKQPARPAAVKISDPAGDAAALVPPSPASGSEETPVKVTRSIMIKRPAGYPSSPRSAASTPPASPLGTTPPISPFAGAEGNHHPTHMRGQPLQGRPATLLPSKCEPAAPSHLFCSLTSISSPIIR